LRRSTLPEEDFAEDEEEEEEEEEEGEEGVFG